MLDVKYNHTEEWKLWKWQLSFLCVRISSRTCSTNFAYTTCTTDTGRPSHARRTHSPSSVHATGKMCLAVRSSQFTGGRSEKYACQFPPCGICVLPAAIKKRSWHLRDPRDFAYFHLHTALSSPYGRL